MNEKSIEFSVIELMARLIALENVLIKKNVVLSEDLVKESNSMMEQFTKIINENIKQ